MPISRVEVLFDRVGQLLVFLFPSLSLSLFFSLNILSVLRPELPNKSVVDLENFLLKDFAGQIETTPLFC